MVLGKTGSGKTASRCSVVKLFAGGRYDLYTYKVYDDLRLVFAPETELAQFGHERDAVTYLRYGLDVAFLRAYEGGAGPAATPHFLKWSAAGVQPGEVVFAAANPEVTSRSITAAELKYLRDSVLPLMVTRLKPVIDQLATFFRPERRQSGVPPNPRWRRCSINTNSPPENSSVSGMTAWSIARPFSKTRSSARSKTIPSWARAQPRSGTTSRWPTGCGIRTKKPTSCSKTPPRPDRLYSRSRASWRVRAWSIPRLKPPRRWLTRWRSCCSAQATWRIYLQDRLRQGRKQRDKDIPIKALLNGKTPQQAAEAAVMGTALKDPATRKKLSGNPAALKSSDDPLIRMALAIDAPAKSLRKKHEDMIGSLEASAEEKIAGLSLQAFRRIPAIIPTPHRHAARAS